MRIRSLAGAGAETEVVVTDVGGVPEAELEEATLATSQSTGRSVRSLIRTLMSLIAVAERV